MASGRPESSEHAPFYRGYIDRVPEVDVVAVLASQLPLVARVASSIAPAIETRAYAPGKWTIRELFGHLIDAERVFSFRAYAFSRGDENGLPGFDENAYVARSLFATTPLAEHVREWTLLREANLLLFRRFDDATWRRAGLANGKSVSVRALAYSMAGHLRHHFTVLAERYGVATGVTA